MIDPRQQDMLILSAISMRCRNLCSSKIARQLGCSPAYVRAATNRVKDADTKESGEDVAAAYWDRPPAGGESWADWGPLPQKSVPTRREPQIISARFGVRPGSRDRCGDTFGLGLTEDEFAQMAAVSGRSESRLFATIYSDEDTPVTYQGGEA